MPEGHITYPGDRKVRRGFGDGQNRALNTMSYPPPTLLYLKEAHV